MIRPFLRKHVMKINDPEAFLYADIFFVSVDEKNIYY
jgi:hypothetical protein